MKTLNSDKQVKNITVAIGDGIGEDIVPAVLTIIKEAGFVVGIDSVVIGKARFDKKYPTGMSDDDLKIIMRNPVFLKGPITTPQGKGYSSINVFLRKQLGLYANIRRCRSYSPYIHATVPDMDVVIVRENEEDLYTGLEYRQTGDHYKAIKSITKHNSMRIAQYAFEYARNYKKKQVACCVKDNIMKLTDGIFAKCFRKIADNYPDIESNCYNIDIASGWLVSKPKKFDVIVTENLYGDIISDIAAEATGSIGICSGSNIGDNYAMFEAVHGSAPDLDRDVANPSALLLGAIDMLNYLGLLDMANTVYNAWLTVIESGIHTKDIYDPGISKKCVGTREFASAIINSLGQKPKHLPPSGFESFKKIQVPVFLPEEKEVKVLVGVDIYINWDGEEVTELVDLLMHAKGEKLSLRSVLVRGSIVWPKMSPNVSRGDCYRCVFANIVTGDPVAHKDINNLLVKLEASHLDVISMDKLYSFNDVPGFNPLSDE